MAMESSASGRHGVRVLSRRLVRPCPSAATELASGCGAAAAAAARPEPETVHLAPWDLQMLTIDYIQKGVLLPTPPSGTSGGHIVEHLASSLARALARFYPFAGRLAVEEHRSGEGGGGPALTVSLRCTGDGAEFVHAAAAGVTVADVGSLYIPRVVWSFFPLDGLVCADAAGGSRPVLAAQVTELADGVFVAMSLNHAVADGTVFWRLFNTWSEISRRTMWAAASDDPASICISAPASLVFERWFPDGCPVPVPLPFAKVDDMIQRFNDPPVEECFFAFSAATIAGLKARANAEMAGAATATISSLQSLLAHVWRCVTRARRLPGHQETSYTVLVGGRGRVEHLPRGYAGNAVVRCTARAAAGEVLANGLGWAAWRLNRAVASQDAAALARFVASWHREPRFAYLAGFWHPAMMVTGNSPRFDAFGNDFGWGRPVAVRSGGAIKVDGRATVYEGRDGGGSMGMELCLAPEVLARLVTDDEFMGALTTVDESTGPRGKSSGR